jgi:hypothetical protein
MLVCQFAKLRLENKLTEGGGGGDGERLPSLLSRLGGRRV